MFFSEKLSSTLSKLKLVAFILTVPSFMNACSTATNNMSVKPSAKELYLVNNPSKKALAKVDALIPKAMKWYDEVEKKLHQKGRKLTEIEKKQAKQLGVKNPDAVRVVILKKFPEPSNRIPNNSHLEGARAMGNIIILKPHLKNNSIVLCHELVHVAQKDRMGLKNFLRQMALEKHILGYSKSLLENEAYVLQKTIM